MDISGWDLPRSRGQVGDSSESEGLLKEDPWDGEEKLSIKEVIRRAAKKSLAKNNEPADHQVRGLKVHPLYELQSDLRWYNRLVCLSALTSLVLGIWQNEIHWETYDVLLPDSPAMGPIGVPSNETAFRSSLKIAVTINVCVTVIAIFYYYRQFLKLEKLRGSMLPQDTFYSAGYMPAWLLESFICLIHPPYFYYFEFQKPERGQLHTILTSDDFFTVMMIPRIYLGFRVFRDLYGLNHENCRHIGTLGGVNLEAPLVLFKNMLYEHPLLVIPTSYFMVILTLSYAMCVFERPSDTDNFIHFKNGMWVTFVTMTTVGYGDLYPQTDLGRIVAVLACGGALVALMFCLIGLDAFLAPNSKEYTAFDIIKKKNWHRKLRGRAVLVLQAFWRSVRALNRPGIPLAFSSVYLADTKLCTLIRNFRDVRREEPLHYMNIGVESFHIYTQTRDLTDKIEELEHAILENKPMRDQMAQEASKLGKDL